MKIGKVCLMLPAMFISMNVQAQTAQPMIQTVVKVYSCERIDRIYKENESPDANLMMKVIRVSDGAVISEVFMGSYGYGGSFGLNIGQCQRYAATLNTEK